MVRYRVRRDGGPRGLSGGANARRDGHWELGHRQRLCELGADQAADLQPVGGGEPNCSGWSDGAWWPDDVTWH